MSGQPPPDTGGPSYPPPGGPTYGDGHAYTPTATAAIWVGGTAVGLGVL